MTPVPIHAGTLAVTEGGELALHVECEGICEQCSGGGAESRVEAGHRLGLPAASN